MHRDTKLGLALGVLLVGIVGAFFFRNQPALPEEDGPALEDPQALDERIAEKPVTPYLGEPESEPAEDEGDDASPPAELQPPTWDVPEFLRNAERDESPPAPVPVEAVSRSSETDTSPSHNNAWRPGESGGGDANARYHVVRRGDTLSGIALKYLGSTARFREVYEANRDVLSSPDDLRPGIRLRIPGRDRPRDDGRTAAQPVSRSRNTGVDESEFDATPQPSKKVDDASERASADEAKPSSPKKKFVPAKSPFRRRISQTPPDDVPSVK